jgi:hypothetical protein
LVERPIVNVASGALNPKENETANCNHWDCVPT